MWRPGTSSLGLCVVEPPLRRSKLEHPARPYNVIHCIGFQRTIFCQSPSNGIDVATLECVAKGIESGLTGGKMLETSIHSNEDQEIAEQKLWRAVIASTVEEWIHGPGRRQREAEQFLFNDDDDYRTVCFSAGIDPGDLRDRLQKRFARAHPRKRLRALGGIDFVH